MTPQPTRDLAPPSHLPDPSDDRRAGGFAPPIVPSVEDQQERRWRSGLPAATWIALLGGALVLAAAASIVVTNWDAIGRTLRIVGLIAGTGGLLIGAERLRDLAPSTSNVIAHVGTLLTTTVGIAALSLFGVTWPGCLVAGGIFGAIASELQAGRWSPQLLRAAQVGAIALATTGIAALTGTTGGLVAAIAALGLLLAGAERRAAALALLAVVSPVLHAVADAGVGDGTFERAGLVGARLGWSGPIVGLLAAMVLAVTARRRRHDGLMVAAAIAPVLGIVTGVAAIDGSVVAWLTVPALVTIAAEAARWLLPSGRLRRPATLAADSIAATVAGLALPAPWIVAKIEPTTSIGHPWAMATSVTAFAVALATLRWRRCDHDLLALGVPALLALVVASIAAIGAGPLPTAMVAVAAAAALFAHSGRSAHPITLYVPAGWALFQIDRLTGDPGTSEWYAAVALAAALAAAVVSARARLAAANGTSGAIEMSAVVVVASVFATTFFDAPLAALVAAATIGTMLALMDRRWVGLFLASAAGIGTVVTNVLIDTDGVDRTAWVGWAAATLGLALVWCLHRSPLAAHAAASGAVVTTTAFVAGRGFSIETIVSGGICIVTVLTGLALTLQRRTPLDSAAVTAGIGLVLAGGLPMQPAWVSAIWTVVGLQTACYGAAMRHHTLSTVGAAITTLATLSWWFTTGIDEWFRHIIAPLGVTAGDVWMLAATATALLVGWALRRSLELNSWLAYGAGLAIGGVWLIGTAIDRDTVWAIPASLTLGVTAAGCGAWHRLAAPLVGGTVLTVAATFVATGSDLGAIPVWVWLAVGGLALLGTAVLIERTAKQGTNLRDLVQRWG